MAAMLGEMLAPKGSHGNEGSDTMLMVTRYEAPLVGILPGGQPGTRGAPRGHDLPIGLRLGPDPFEEIESQGIDGIRQRGLSKRQVLGSLPPIQRGLDSSRLMKC
jgi:hypothetical protein